MPNIPAELADRKKKLFRFQFGLILQICQKYVDDFLGWSLRNTYGHKSFYRVKSEFHEFSIPVTVVIITVQGQWIYCFML